MLPHNAFIRTDVQQHKLLKPENWQKTYYGKDHHNYRNSN